MKIHNYLFVAFLILASMVDGLAQVQSFPEGKMLRLTAQQAKLNTQTVELVPDDRIETKEGVSLKQGIKDAIHGEREQADLSYIIKAPKAGLYVFSTYAVTDAEGAALMKRAKSKFESLFMRMQIGDARGTKRVVYVPWDRPRQETGIFTLTGNEQEIKIWLPRGVRLSFMEIRNYAAPKVPAAAANYSPKVLPPKSHPRLWVNQENLPKVKENLTKEENRAVWESLKAAALVPFNFTFDPAKEMSYNEGLEKATEQKAFYYLMTGDKKIGREAIDLTKNYLANVEFGNILDITRELGRAIYTASLVYDWTYDLLTPEEKKVMVGHFMRLARDMEIGWPPFRMKILNGHGNEAMVNRDFLAMSIAIYDEDPTPYQYVSYAILEELVPMRKFEYQSPRHNQGVGYGAYRFAWEMHGALLYQRMTGEEVFDKNIKGLSDFFLYMRSPGGEMLRDGDGFASGKPGEPFYWKSPLVMFLMYAYSKDPIVKGEFLRHGNLNNPTLYLLLNDPDLKPESSLTSLPLSKDFGTVLGSMIARTGWNIGPDSDDVVAEIKGGGYHFGNHQHADAGSLQLYYRGFQLGDLGLYRFYGTPYDMGFNKRSVSHSMMLAYDPNEKFERSQVNDGGARLNQRAPSSPEETTTNPWFNNGVVSSTMVGPSTEQPFFSYFSVDLKGPYSDKIDQYQRSFCFLNMGRKDVPAVIVLTDAIETKSEDIAKYWQINSNNAPEVKADGFVLHNQLMGRVGKTDVSLLTPQAGSYQIQVLSDSSTSKVFGTQLEVPESHLAEGKGHRTMVSYKDKSKFNRFVTVFQVLDGNHKPLSLAHKKNEAGEVIYIGDQTVVIAAEGITKKPFSFSLTNKGKTKVVMTGLTPGNWSIKKKKRTVKTFVIKDKENAGYVELAGKGSFTVSPN